MGEGLLSPGGPWGPTPTFQAQRSALCCPHQGLSLTPTSCLPLMTTLWSCAPFVVNLGGPPSWDPSPHHICRAPWSCEVTGSRDLDVGGRVVFVQPIPGPCDTVLLAVESARDAQGASQEGWVQSRSPRERPLTPGDSGTHTLKFPCLSPLILSTWGAARRGE